MTTHADLAAQPRVARFRIARVRAAASPARPPLVRGERVLVIDRDVTGAPVVATTLAIYHGGSDGAPEGTDWRRLGWVDVGRVRWDPYRDELALTSLSPVASAHLTVRLARRTRLPALARERVGATLVACCQVPVGGRVAAVVQARRAPGAHDVIWVVLVNGTADLEDQAVADTVRSAIDRMRTDIGL
jgi:hypothetical protein